MNLSPAQFARLIDHTVLKPETVEADVDRLCAECVEYGFFAACVQPVWVKRCIERLAGTNVVVATVAGFPHGASLPESKAFEARAAVEQGALEVDMVVYIGDLIAGRERAVRNDIAAVVNATHAANPGALVKVILETRALTNEQIELGCRCARDAGAAFVKTSTGFHAAGGATPEHVRLLKTAAKPLLVTASGG